MYLCLGDLVGYGPHADECLALALDICGKDNVILGNHEEMFKRKAAFPSCSELAKSFFDTAFPRFKSHHLLDGLKLNANLDIDGVSVDLMHTLDNKHIYPNTIVSEGVSADFTFIGHSHIQFSKKITTEMLINVGSLGQNRKHKELACYANLYTESKTVEFCSFLSPKDQLIKDMKVLGYPQSLLDYYKS
jgi:predicted phosphodiesterase